ncbi:MAG: hypothetical protein NTZ49_05540 [Candidatus Parcubacteria bacterium]|nr:hypothetical protein [Candidatus Parcubacteria bacterium]
MFNTFSKEGKKMDIRHILKDHAYQNIPLTYYEAFELGVYALEGCKGNSLAQIQSIAALCALHGKATYEWQEFDHASSWHSHSLPKTAAEQIAGICAAIFEHDIALSEFGFLNPRVPYAMDNCGMGGDLIVTANVSTISAFIAAAAGIPICKHGSPANADAGKHGSSDFISMLGIDLFAHKNDTERCVETEGFGYTEALDVRYKRIHLQTHEVARLPHMNDIIGPITNPLAPHLLTRRIVGVNHLIPVNVVAQAYLILNSRGVTQLEHGLFVRGFADRESCRGMDEVSICPGGTQVAEIIDGEIKNYTIFAEDFGIKPVDAALISPPSGISKGEFSLAILKQEVSGPAVEMVLANAALLFYLADFSRDMRSCYNRAKEVYLSGAPYQKVLAVSKMLPKKS